MSQKLKTELNKTIPEALSNFDALPDSAYIRLNVLKRLYGVSTATIYRCIKKGTIPAQRKLSERCSAWSVKQVREALAAKEDEQP